MFMNLIQFQSGLSMPKFFQQLGIEVPCTAIPEKALGSQNISCFHCDERSPRFVRNTFQCRSCRHQTSFILGALFMSTKPPLSIWLLGIGIYTSTCPFSLEGEGWDEGDIKGCFYSPLPNPLGNCSLHCSTSPILGVVPPASLQVVQQERDLGRLATHCIYNAKKLCRYLWLLGIYLISQARAGLSALALKRQSGVSYPSSWLFEFKFMHTMAERKALYCSVQVDDAYFNGELGSGSVDSGSENKMCFVAAVSLSNQEHPLHIKLTPAPFIADVAKYNFSSSCLMLSDGLTRFYAVTDADCLYRATSVDRDKPKYFPHSCGKISYW
ncbi:MAG: hypothetical protein Q7U66_18855 [Methylobacter sp.]|nr:hypothetical protein [Methylobacter sp.]